MVEIALEECRRLSGRHGLPLEFVAKEHFVFDVMARIAAGFAGDESVVFKGGTAINKIYVPQGMQRFSSDLDYDFISGEKDVRSCMQKAEEIASKAGLRQLYEITEFRRVAGTVQFYCAYDSPLGKKDNVRVDIAAKKRGTTLEKPGFKAAFSFFTGQSVTAVRTYSLDDLLARKMLALSDRCEGKDVYDVACALPLSNRLPAALDAVLGSEGKYENASGFLRSACATLRGSDPRKLSRLSNPFIPLANRPRDWRQFVLSLANDLQAKSEGD